MQSQMAAMAGMNANVGGPVDGTPIMGNMPRPVRPQEVFDVREKLNTYIYDYFIRNGHPRLARTMLESDIKMSLKPSSKPSPSGRNVNGIDGIDPDARDGLPEAQLPEGQLADNSFLLDWWAQFWDIYNAARRKSPSGEKGAQYITHTRVRAIHMLYTRCVALTCLLEPYTNAQRSAEPTDDDGQQCHGRPISEHDTGHAQRHRRRLQRPKARSPEQPQSVCISSSQPPSAHY